MTDNSPWQSPSGPAEAPAAPPPAFAAPSASTTPGVAMPPGAPGWTPPPKPGLIPLRPMTLGTMLSASFQVLRRNPRPTFGFSLLINGGMALLSLIFVGLVAVFAFGRLANAAAEDVDQLALGAMTQVWLSALVPVALSIATTAVLQGIISLEVARGTVGERLRLAGLWRQAKGRIGVLVGWSFLLVGAIVVVLLVLAVAIGLVFAFGGDAGLVIGVLLTILAIGVVAVLFAWVGTRVSLVPSALVLERLPLRAAIGRSWSLTVGYFWKTLGIQLLVAVILSTVQQIIVFPLSFVFGIGAAFLDPSGDFTGVAVGIAIVYVLTLLIVLVFASISAIVQSACATLIYLDLRMRKEGLDLELTKYVEARQSGDTSVADPYRVTPSGQTPAT